MATQPRPSRLTGALLIAGLVLTIGAPGHESLLAFAAQSFVGIGLLLAVAAREANPQEGKQ